MSDLPRCWAKVELATILELNKNAKPFQQGWSPRCEKYPAEDGQWGVLKTTAIQHGVYWAHENKKLPDHLDPKPQLQVQSGDILMTCAGPRSRCGVACLVTRTPPRLMMSGKMYRFRPRDDVMQADFLVYYLQSHDCQVSIDRMKTGINDSGLNLTHGRFAGLEIPIAPRNEQRRIVQKIEHLLGELEVGADSLRQAKSQLSLYRRSVLKHAFEGKLTADFRARHRPKQPLSSSDSVSAEDLISESLAQLPDSWRYERLATLADADRPITYGVIKLGADTDNGIPVLRSSDVRPLRIDLASVKRIAPKIASQYQRTFLRGGEVLITVRGTLGGVAVVPPALAEWNISREVAMIAPSDRIDAEYLQYMLASPQMEVWLKSRLRGVAYTGINLETLRSTPVIFCSIDEQREIVKRLNQNISRIDDMEREIVNQESKVEVLRYAILKSAFTGKLTEQNLNDETAHVLLERIRSESPVKKSAKVKTNGPRKRNNKKRKDMA